MDSIRNGQSFWRHREAWANIEDDVIQSTNDFQMCN